MTYYVISNYVAVSEKKPDITFQLDIPQLKSKAAVCVDCCSGQDEE